MPALESCTVVARGRLLEHAAVERAERHVDAAKVLKRARMEEAGEEEEEEEEEEAFVSYRKTSTQPQEGWGKK